MKKKKYTDGFTLLELLVVIGIIAILAGLLFPAITGALRTAQKNKAIGDCRAIETAIMQYYNEYNKWPGSGGSVNSIIDILIGGSSSTAQNPRQSKFLTADVDSSGNLLDPWDNAYQYTCDDDYNNEVVALGTTLKKSVAVWSEGRDGNANTVDDAKTW